MEQDYIYMEETTVKSSSEVRNVHICIRSVVEGVENLWETTGEYKWDCRQHMLAYTDYTGNAITKNGIFADHEKMLLHRVGAITCDMLFDPLTATMVDYSFPKQDASRQSVPGITIYLRFHAPVSSSIPNFAGSKTGFLPSFFCCS